MDVFPLILLILGLVAGLAAALWPSPYAVRAAGAGVVLVAASLLIHFN